LEHGSALGLRYLLNAAPPEEELVLEVDALNSPRRPPVLETALRAEETLRRHLGHAATEVRGISELRAAWVGAPQSGGSSDRLPQLARRTEDVLNSALTLRRPDLLNGHLEAFTRELDRSKEETILQAAPELLKGIHSALAATIHVMRLEA
jgi:hypothetical protein